MKAIKEVLGVSQHQYDYLMIDKYTHWCGRNSSNNYELQVLLSNQTIFNWFKSTYESLELEFYDRITSKSNHHNLHIYSKTMEQIIGYHPPISLLKKIKKAGLENAINPAKFNLN